MKPIFLSLLAAIILFSTHVSAQRKGLNFEANINYGYNHLNRRDFMESLGWGTIQPGDGNLNEGPFWGIAAGAGYMFNNYIGIFGGLGLDRYRWIFVVDPMVKNKPRYEMEQKQYYITLPLYVKLITSRPGRVGAYATIGAQFSFNRYAPATITWDPSVGRAKTRTDNTGWYRGNFLPLIGLGILIPVTKDIEINVGIRTTSQSKNQFDREVILAGGNFITFTANIGLTVRLPKRE